MIGAQTGGAVHNNRFRRVGYVCSDDTSASVPKWLANRYATALEKTGDARKAKGVLQKTLTTKTAFGERPQAEAMLKRLGG